MSGDEPPSADSVTIAVDPNASEAIKATMMGASPREWLKQAAG